MLLTLEELMEMRDELIRHRARGTKVVQQGAERVDFKTDAEMATAISDLEARIRRASTARPAAVRFSSSKGF